MLIGSAFSGCIDTLLEVQLVDTAYISDFHVHGSSACCVRQW